MQILKEASLLLKSTFFGNKKKMNHPPSDLYNRVSQSIKRKYRIVYSEWRPDNVTTFKTEEEKWGALRNEEDILIQPVYDSIYYNEIHKIFEGVNFNKDKSIAAKSYFFHHLNGSMIAHLEGYDSIRIDDYKNAIFNKHSYETHTSDGQTKIITKYNFGLLDDSFKEVIPPVYESLGSLSKNLLRAKKNNHWGIINRTGSVVLDFKADQILGNFENPFILVEMEGTFVRVNESGIVMGKLPFSFLLQPCSNSYWWKFQKDKEKLKSIVSGERRIERNDFYPFDDVTEYSGKWGIVTDTGETLIEPLYDYIDFLGLTNCYKVFKGNIHFEKNQDFQTSLKGAACGIISSTGKEIIALEYDWITEIEVNLWAVNIGGEVFFNDEYQEEYWTVKGGKWGVLNEQAKVIVPIEYDSLMLNWYRVKDYIFVQKNTKLFDGDLEYDVYDFKGKKITANKPNYKNHIYYR